MQIRVSLNLVSHSEDNIMGQFYHILTTSYFSCNGEFYRHSDRMAVQSPLYPLAQDLHVEDLDKRSLYKAIHKLLYWFYYISGIIIIWPHWPENVTALLDHNSVKFIIVDRIPDVSLEELKLTAPTFYTNCVFFDILLF